MNDGDRNHSQLPLTCCNHSNL